MGDTELVPDGQSVNVVAVLSMYSDVLSFILSSHLDGRDGTQDLMPEI
jgi:hypothetical protein